MSIAASRLPATTKFGTISSMWEMDDDARRQAIIKRAARGAAKTLGKRRDLIVIDPTPEPIGLNLVIPSGAPAWKRILYETAIKHAVLPIDILSDRRNAPVVAARQEVMWRLRNETTMSFLAIARRMRRDHSTCLYGIRRHEERLKAESAGVSS